MFSRLSFTARIFLATAGLVVLALGTAAVATYTRGYQIASNAANESLEHSRAVQQNLQTLRFQRLQLMSRLLATDPAFLSYVVEAGGNNLLGGGTVDVRSIVDLLTERQAEIGFDFGMVLDPNGAILAANGISSAANEVLAGDPVVAGVMKSQSAGTGYWIRGGKVYQIAVAPLANRDELAGYLVLALTVDPALLQEVKQVSGSELVMLDTSAGKYTSVTATLEPTQLDDLSQSLANLHPLPSGVFSLGAGGVHWLAHADPLGANGTALTLTSFDQAMGGFRSILTDELIAAVIVMLLAVALSWWLSRRLVQPLRELSEGAQSAARGEYQRRFEAKGTGEIAELTRAFDSLLSDLREKTEIENYMADLAKYQVETGAEQVTSFGPVTLAPESLSGTFLAVRMQDGIDASVALPDKALLAFNMELRNLEVPAKLQGGKLAAIAGNTAFLSFENAEAALTAAGHILSGAAGRGEKLSAALAQGRVITGPAEWTSGGGASLLGAPIRQLEELLPEAAPGTVLATPEFAKKAGSVPGTTVKSQAGAVSQSRTFNAVEPPAPSVLAVGEGETMAGTLPIPGSGVLSMKVKLAPGIVLGNRYEILSELGAGGMAVVYKARDRQLNEVVALKTLKSDSGDNSALLDAMKSEIRLARKITHRNVLRIFDFGEVEGVPFISMEYIRGMTLKYLLQNRNRIPVAAGLRILRQVCTALQVAHGESVLHRDIKPENVMLEASGNAKLMDFGIATAVKRGDGHAREQYVVGTPRYASPEQLQGDPMDERTDVYALGVMMYQMFTGKLPFTDVPLDRLLENKTKENYQPPSNLVKDFPPGLEALIVACLKADKEARPKSAQALLETLEKMRV